MGTYGSAAEKSPTVDTCEGKSPTVDTCEEKSPTVDTSEEKSPTVDTSEEKSPTVDTCDEIRPVTLGIGHDSLQRLTSVLVVMATRVSRRIIPCRFHTYIKYKDKAYGTVPCTCYIWVGPAFLLSVWSLHSTLHMLLLGGVCTLPCSYFGVGSVLYPAFVISGWGLPVLYSAVLLFLCVCGGGGVCTLPCICYFWVGTACTLPCSSFLFFCVWGGGGGGFCTLPCSWCFWVGSVLYPIHDTAVWDQYCTL